jgi:RpiB/LacA/LacB family sugar-phosphate isomerase
MKIAIAADHGGFNLKETIKKHLIRQGHRVHDFGANVFDKADDYPDFAIPAAKSVGSGENDAGILICSTGIGMSIAANKVPGVRAALALSKEFACMAKSHNNANVITLPGKGQIGDDEATQIVEIFLRTKFEGGRHARRVGKIE